MHDLFHFQIQWPESKVKFEFCSQPGDISFGILFVAAPDPDNKSDDLEVCFQ